MENIMVDEVQVEKVVDVEEEVVAPKELTFSVTIEEANVILGGLGELPAKISMGLIQKLQQQAQPQL
jgi:hypothetical protein